MLAFCALGEPSEMALFGRNASKIEDPLRKDGPYEAVVGRKKQIDSFNPNPITYQIWFVGAVQHPVLMGTIAPA